MLIRPVTPLESTERTSPTKPLLDVFAGPEEENVRRLRAEGHTKMGTTHPVVALAQILSRMK